MIKHTDYDNPCKITITKAGEDNYILEYEQESYTYVCSKEELLEELGEHLDNMNDKENQND